MTESRQEKLKRRLFTCPIILILRLWISSSSHSFELMIWPKCGHCSTNSMSFPPITKLDWIQNWDRRIERWRHFCFSAPSSGQNYFRSDFKTVRNANNLWKVVNVTLIVNRCRSIEWLPQIYPEAPPSGRNCLRSMIHLKYEAYWTENVKQMLYKSQFKLSVKDDNYDAYKTANIKI